MRPYMVTKGRCVWNKTFLLGSTVFNNNVSVHQILATPTKVSNDKVLICDVA